MTISAVFKSTIPSCNYVFKDGRTAVFVSGKYMTSDESQVAELAAEVGEVGVSKSRHPHIYVDENEQEIDSEALSPLEEIKLKAKEEARRELLAEQAQAQARALDATANVSNSKAKPEDFVTSVANTTNIAQVGGVESNSAAEASAGIGAKLTNLNIGKAK